MNRALTLLFGSYLVALPAVATAQTTNEPPPVGGAPTATAATSAADIGTPNGTPPAIFKQGTMEALVRGPQRRRHHHRSDVFSGCQHGSPI